MLSPVSSSPSSSRYDLRRDSCLSRDPSASSLSCSASREEIPFSSTPGLSLAVSSSLAQSSEDVSPHSPGLLSREVGSRINHSSEEALFAHHLGRLLQAVSDQQFDTETRGKPPAQPLSCIRSPDAKPKSGALSMNSATILLPHGSDLSQTLDSDSASGHLPGDDLLSHKISRASRVSRAKRRFSDDAPGHSAAPTTNNRRPLVPLPGSYMSASDCASISPLSHDLDVGAPPPKKQRTSSLSHTGVITGYRAGHAAPMNSGPPLASNVRFSLTSEWRVPGANKEDVFDIDLVTPSHFRSAGIIPLLGQNTPPHPPTQPLTRVPTPNPPTPPHQFAEGDIPRVYLDRNDAAEARLRLLLKKEALHRSREGPCALAALGVASQDDFIAVVIDWILAACPSKKFAGIHKKQRESVLRGDLHEQLNAGHDTRFLAAHIFTWFFCYPHPSGKKSRKVLDEIARSSELDSSEKLIVWDFAVAAIALAVKVRPQTAVHLTSSHHPALRAASQG
ncbi:hypothetical protein BC834DRAFT_302252 [Gloeopeniophorella convolvens]|nr:hypothetical protein BC834DRAFT_302252 [Gloeopeniophorella convolvens]